MSLTLLQGSIELGLIYSLVALALFISYRILDIADLTVDGSFTLGCAVAAMFTLADMPFVGIFVAMIAGAGAGLVTAILQTKLKVQPILAGIITMTALYSTNLIVMGNRANVPLLQRETIYTFFSILPSKYAKLIVIAVILLIVSIAIVVFMKSATGLAIRATGDNPSLVKSSSINPAFTITVGLCVANGLVGLSGALLAQYQLFAEMTTGTGMVVIGLASLIMGEAIVGRGGMARSVAGCLVGAIIYRVIIALAISMSIPAGYLKLVSASIVAIAISYPAVKEQIHFARLKNAAKKENAQNNHKMEA